MKPNKTISILLTLIILLETLIPSLQNIAYGVEDIIEEVESQSEEVIESEIEESIDEVIEKENEEPSEDVSNLEIDAVQEEGIAEENIVQDKIEDEENLEVKEENSKAEEKEELEGQDESSEAKENLENQDKHESIDENEIEEQNKAEENSADNNENTTNTIVSSNEAVLDNIFFNGTQELGAETITLSGSGTEADPYIIYSAQELNSVRNNLSAHYKLGGNINLNEYENWIPIGDNTNQFTGSLDGANFTISNLNINANINYVGLFGYSTGTIKNIKLENSNVIGLTYTGALVGYSTGAIENIEVIGGKIIGTDRTGGIVGEQQGNATSCIAKIDVEGTTYVGGMFGAKGNTTLLLSYATGNVKATGDSIGGLIGTAGGTIEKCYATGDVVSTGNTVGGLVGYGNATIKECYATGSVKGVSNVGGLVGHGYWSTLQNNYAIGNVKGTGSSIGGLIGYNYSTGVTNSYWLPETTSQMTSSGGERNSVVQMSTQAGYTSWDFETIWAIEEKTTLAYIKELPMPESIKLSTIGVGVFYDEGDGTEGNPYIIKTPEQLKGIENDLNSYYKLGENIDLSEYKNWTPIGDATYQFTGGLDGDGYIISNLKINANINYVGLFGYSTGTIKNIKLENSNVIGLTYTGALVGYSTGAIENIEVIGGKIIGTDRTGGIVGEQQGNATSCIAKIDVEGTTYVGGMFGAKGNTTLLLSYATGNVKATGDSIGGLIGTAGGTIEKCYATGDVVSTGNTVGGLVGYGNATIKECYATGSVKGVSNVGGLVGHGYWSTLQNNYAIGNVKGTGSSIGGLIGYNYSTGVTNSYWLPETTSQMTSSGGERNSVVQMSTQAGYTSWDFETIWAIEEKTTLAYIKELPMPESIKLSTIGVGVFYDEGDGTEGNPYIIKTPEQLKGIENDLNSYYKLGENIDLSEYKNWTPIGDATYQFTGGLDGDGYIISNLKIKVNFKTKFQ